MLATTGKPVAFAAATARPGFRQILHRLHHETVGSAAGQSFGLFGEGGAQFLFGHVAVHQHFAAGPNRSKDQRAFARRFARKANARLVDFFDAIRAAALGQADAVGAERIRQDDLRTGFDVGARHRGNFFGWVRFQRSGTSPGARPRGWSCVPQAPSVSTGPWAINC